MSLDPEKEIIDTWNNNNRINLYILDAIAPEALSDASASKGRNVAQQFAHLHNVRLMWLKASGPELMEGIDKVEKEVAADKKLLTRSLKESGRAMEALLKKAATEGKVKGFKPHVTAFLGYVLAHESHHRGQIALALKQSGHTHSTRRSRMESGNGVFDRRCRSRFLTFKVSNDSQARLPHGFARFRA